MINSLVRKQMTATEYRRWCKYQRKQRYGKNDKRTTQQEHARKRFYQRYGIVFNRKIERFLSDQIQNGSALFLCRQSARVSVHKVKLDNRWIPVVYDCNRSQIVTCLPKDFKLEDVCED